MTIWAMVAVGAVLVVALVLFLIASRDKPEAATEAAAGAPSPSAPDPVEEARAPLERRREGDEGGSKLASDPPPPASPAVLSTEVDLSLMADDEDEPSGPLARILVTAVGSTHAGRRRKHNEDAFLVLAQHSLFAIADGMGGYAAGEVASQMAIDVITAAFDTNHFGGSAIAGLPPRGDELVRAIQSANSAILTQARSNEAQAGMGTTVVAARFSANRKRCYIAHVGDSRLYRLRGVELKQLTTDHTLGAMGIQGPSANKLSRAVGVFDDVEVDLNIDEPEVGDYYIICSDGLSKMVPEPDIADIVASAPNLDAAVERLIAEANERGGKDNVSVILIRVDEPELGPQA